MMGFITRTATTVGLMLSVVSCAYKTQTTDMAIDYNTFVADTANSNMVLNILNARDRIPLQFTSVNSINGTLEGTFTAGLGASVNGQSTALGAAGDGVGASSALVVEQVTRGATNYSPSMSINVKSGTVFTVGIDNNKEFFNGIISALPPTTVVALLRQGYPENLLSNLLMSRMTFFAALKPTNPTNENRKKVRRVLRLYEARNTPDDPEDSYIFAETIMCRMLSYNFKPDNVGKKTGKDGQAADPFGLALSALDDDDQCKRARGRILHYFSTAMKDAGDTLKDEAGADVTLAQSRKEMINTKEQIYYEPSTAILLPAILEQRKTQLKGAVSAESLTVREESEEIAQFSQTANGVIFKLPNYFNDYLKEFGPKETLILEDTCQYLKDIYGEFVTKSKALDPTIELTETTKIGGRNTNQIKKTKRKSKQTKETVKVKNYALCNKDKNGKPIDAPLVSKYRSGDLYIALSLRSVEGIMYYLGEYLRDLDHAPMLASSSSCGKDATQKAIRCLPVFVALSKAELKTCQKLLAGPVTLISSLATLEERCMFAKRQGLTPENLNSLVKVRHQKATYFVPISGRKLNAVAGRSSQVLGLLHTLLNLNRSSDRAPGTPLVQNIN